MLSGEITLLVEELAQDCNGAFALDETDDRGNGMFWGNLDAHVNMVVANVTLDDIAFLHLGKGAEDRTEVFLDLTEDDLSSVFGDKDNMVFAVPFGMG